MKEKIYKGVVLAIGVAILIALFTNKQKPDLSLIKELVAAKDSLSQSRANERDIYRQWNDQLNAEIRKKDSILSNTYQKNNKVIYEKIPVTVVNYSNDELRRAVYDYK